jgi:hypothetical protein
MTKSDVNLHGSTNVALPELPTTTAKRRKAKKVAK